MADERIRIGVVGGGFGASFQWHLDPNCVVEAVSDLREDRRNHLMNTYQCTKAYNSLEELILDDAIDAVAIFTEAPNHVRHDVMAMDKGKHVISAVPAGCNLEELEELVEAKKRNGVRYMMAETSYYRPECMMARRLYQDGKFGEIVYCEGEYYHPGIGAANDGLSTWNGQRTWRYGYPPMLYPTHSTAFLVGVTGERLVRVSCLGETKDDPGFKDNAYDNPFANASALFQTSGGHMFRCNVMWDVWNHGERAQWFGQHMSLYMSAWSGQPHVLKIEGQADVPTIPDFQALLPESMRIDSGHGGSHTYLTHEFVMALMEDREPSVNVYEAVAMTAPGVVAHQSCFKDGEQLPVPSFDPE